MSFLAVSLQRLVSFLVAFSLLTSSIGIIPSPASATSLFRGHRSQLAEKEILFRTRVQLRQPADLARVTGMATHVLASGEDWALLVVDEGQLADLARLGFQPRQTDTLRQLGFTRATLSSSELLAALAVTPMADADEDGLTDTEEGWWCTDPNNPNSDGDAQGYSDGEEVYALLNFTLPRSVRWGYGPPFGPPNAWPDFNGQDGDPDTPACNDGYYDTVPDFAEVYMVGSNVLEESTDRDKFDDGQELFGVTYCPGAPTSCGYGNYPRQEYWNFIKATMPSWVLPPGDNLFVAAFPQPDVSAVPGSWTMNRVTVITTSEGQMTETTKSYETSVTEGTSTSVADTVTWNNWEEVSESVETPIYSSHIAQLNSPEGDPWDGVFGSAKIIGGLGLIIGGCTIGAFTVAACVGGVAGGGLAIVEGLQDWAWFNNDVNRQDVPLQLNACCACQRTGEASQAFMGQASSNLCGVRLDGRIAQ